MSRQLLLPDDPKEASVSWSRSDKKRLVEQLRSAVVVALPGWWTTTVGCTLEQVYQLRDQRHDLVTHQAAQVVLWDLAELVRHRQNGTTGSSTAEGVEALKQLSDKVAAHGLPGGVAEEVRRWLPAPPSDDERRTAAEEARLIQAAWVNGGERLRWMRISESLLPPPPPVCAAETSNLKGFIKAAAPVVRELTDDLLQSAKKSPHTLAAMRARAALERKSFFEAWCRTFAGQVAAAWAMACVIARTLEDRGLATRRLAGPGAAETEQRLRELDPTATETDYLLLLWRDLGARDLLRRFLGPTHSPVWLMAPTPTATRRLLGLFRSPDPATPTFTFGGADTRFLGDLYQELNQQAVERDALVQTPDFVASFILDRTLEPAVEKFGVADTDVLDPSCGCGHFLVAAFDRLHAHLLRADPTLTSAEAARRAVGAVAGIDINPEVVAIARLRLHLAYLGKLDGPLHLDALPELPPLHVAVGDGLLPWGPAEWQDWQKSRRGTGVLGPPLATVEQEEAKYDQLAEAMRQLDGGAL